MALNTLRTHPSPLPPLTLLDCWYPLLQEAVLQHLQAGPQLGAEHGAEVNREDGLVVLGQRQEQLALRSASVHNVMESRMG